MPFWHFLRHHFVKSAKTALFTTRGDDRVKGISLSFPHPPAMESVTHTSIHVNSALMVVIAVQIRSSADYTFGKDKSHFFIMVLTHAKQKAAPIVIERISLPKVSIPWLLYI